jgi:8-oxo-dGTP pyrophosphatase MutT (NUDIX family)
MENGNLLSELTAALHSDSLLDLSLSLQSYACVVILLRGSRDDLEVGFIRRAIHEHDRWSGQIAFPGGKKDDADENDMRTALRETAEEIGLHLDVSNYAGRLDDIQARKAGEVLDFFIRPFVFYLDHEVETTLAPDEVAEFFWVKLNDLRSPARQTTHKFQKNTMTLQVPAIDVQRDLPLWGLSYFMTQNLLNRLTAFGSNS